MTARSFAPRSLVPASFRMPWTWPFLALAVIAGSVATFVGAYLTYALSGGITLEVCPTSNVRTRSVPSLEEHPLPKLFAAGVPVTINSDDPPMFGTTLNAEYEIAAKLLALDDAGVAELARTAVRASFAEPSIKASLLGEIDAYTG